MLPSVHESTLNQDILSKYLEQFAQLEASSEKGEQSSRKNQVRIHITHGM